MEIPWILLYFIWVHTCSTYVVGLSNEGYIHSSKMGWWEARNTCNDERNTDLFIPSDALEFPADIVTGTYYWVGGLEMSQWKWTDNAPLFTPIGQYDISNIEHEDILGNSVLECYRSCVQKRIGLSGVHCYCLEDVDIEEKNDTTAPIGRCPGNRDEECGTTSTMSVYEIDIDFKVSSNGDDQCGYVYKSWLRNIEVETKSCNESSPAVCVNRGNTEPSCEGDSIQPFKRCVNDLCVTCNSTDWSTFNQTCNLTRVSPTKESDFVDLLERSSEIQRNININTHDTDGPRCLALKLSSDELEFHWISCSREEKSLCTRRENASEHITTRTEEGSLTTVTDPTVATSRVHSTTSTTEETTIKLTTDKGEGHSTAGRMQKDDTTIEQNDMGIIFGVSIGVAFVVTVILVVIVMKRKNKCCFKQATKDSHAIAMVNTAYTSSMGMEVGAADDNYDTTGSHRVDNMHDNTYDHTDTRVGSQQLIRGNEQGTYDHTGQNVWSNLTSNNEQDTYDHAEPVVRSNLTIDNEQDTYDHTGQNVRSNLTFNNEQDTYDHAEPVVRSNLTIDNEQDTYDHAGVHLGSNLTADNEQDTYINTGSI